MEDVVIPVSSVPRSRTFPRRDEVDEILENESMRYGFVRCRAWISQVIERLETTAVQVTTPASDIRSIVNKKVYRATYRRRGVHADCETLLISISKVVSKTPKITIIIISTRPHQVQHPCGNPTREAHTLNVAWPESRRRIPMAINKAFASPIPAEGMPISGRDALRSASPRYPSPSKSRCLSVCHSQGSSEMVRVSTTDVLHETMAKRTSASELSRQGAIPRL